MLLQKNEELKKQLSSADKKISKLQSALQRIEELVSKAGTQPAPAAVEPVSAAPAVPTEEKAGKTVKKDMPLQLIKTFNSLNCPVCGNLVAEGSHICLNCKTEFDPAYGFRDLAGSSSSGKSKEPVVPLMMESDFSVRCPVCGTVQRSDRHVCFHCGSQFKAYEK